VSFGLAAFNLLLNGVLSFALACALAWGAIRWLRIPPGRAQLVLTSLPFAKLAFDLARGIPEGAFVWQRAAGVPRDLGVFQVGLGLEWLFLRIDFQLGALAHGTRYSDSAADILAALLSKRVSPWAPLVVAAALLAVGVARLTLRARDWLSVARLAASLRSEQPVHHETLGRRRIPIYLRGPDAGGPFAFGLWRRAICFPRGLWCSLPIDERAAAIKHELGHLAERHLSVLLAAGVIEDLFWFVPGMRSARRRLHDALEGAADSWAIRHGCSPLTLASALVRVAETEREGELARATCAATGGGTRARVIRLIEPACQPRLGCQRPWLRALLTAWLVGSVLVAVTLGNH
jgi:beta-lactamase regulating signal transducer with metallopeptidase domain